jgi:hypothetical protein
MLHHPQRAQQRQQQQQQRISDAITSDCWLNTCHGSSRSS